jgi:uncharacterized membrane protein (UPF0127 family)
MNRRRRILAVIGGLVLLGALALLMTTRLRAGHDSYEPQTARLRINGESIFVTIPRTAAESAKGLGGVTSLGPDRGMLWRYDQPQMVTFWMKNMNIPIDFIWISGGQVIGVTADVPPPADNIVSNLKIYRPPSTIDRVLEVNSGYAVQHQITVGTKVTEFNF